MQRDSDGRGRSLSSGIALYSGISSNSVSSNITLLVAGSHVKASGGVAVASISSIGMALFSTATTYSGSNSISLLVKGCTVTTVGAGAVTSIGVAQCSSSSSINRNKFSVLINGCS
jgi:hypothetical protein